MFNMIKGFISLFLWFELLCIIYAVCAASPGDTYKFVSQICILSLIGISIAIVSAVIGNINDKYDSIKNKKIVNNSDKFIIICYNLVFWFFVALCFVMIGVLVYGAFFSNIR